jgi:hypothetical protein
MALTQLAKAEWQDYFDRVSKVLGAKLVEIEVTGLDSATRLKWTGCR